MNAIEQEAQSRQELEKLIDKALAKVKGRNENELCKYLPGPTGGYMHHFTMRKLKNSSPAELFAMLQKFVLSVDSPRAFEPKPRAPRGSRKKRDIINFTRTDIEKVLELAERVGDKDLMARFSPKRSLPALKRELIRSIRENRIEQNLWNAYFEAISLLNGSLHAL